MGILDFYFRKKYNNTIKDLGFQNPSPKFLLLPIENDDDGRRLSNHSIVIKTETAIALLKSISIKGSRDRIIYQAFLNWIDSPPTVEIAEISPLLKTEARWLYLLLQKNTLNVESHFDFLCHDCNKIYQFNGKTIDRVTSKDEGYVAKENNPVRVYDVIYCPYKHLIYRRIRMYISP